MAHKFEKTGDRVIQHLFCDDCGEEQEELYLVGGDDVCADCGARLVRNYRARLRRQGRWADLEEIMDRPAMYGWEEKA